MQVQKETVRIFRSQPRSPHPGSGVCEVALQGLQTLLCRDFHVRGAEAFKEEFFFKLYKFRCARKITARYRYRQADKCRKHRKLQKNDTSLFISCLTHLLTLSFPYIFGLPTL